MIFTFQRINSTRKYMFFEENIRRAKKEIKVRLGDDAENWSLIAYVPVHKFSLFID